MAKWPLNSLKHCSHHNLSKCNSKKPRKLYHKKNVNIVRHGVSKVDLYCKHLLWVSVHYLILYLHTLIVYHTSQYYSQYNTIKNKQEVTQTFTPLRHGIMHCYTQFTNGCKSNGCTKQVQGCLGLVMDYIFSFLLTFQTHLISHPCFRTRKSPTDLQHLCCKAINK